MATQGHQTDSAKFRAWLRPDGVVQFAWQPGFAVGGADAAAAMDAGREAARGAMRGVLVDMRTLGVMDKSARTVFSAPNDWAHAVALWVNSPLSTVLANFFLGVSRARIPVRMFTREADAVAWLKTQGRRSVATRG